MRPCHSVALILPVLLFAAPALAQNPKGEDDLYALYLARAGAIACAFPIDAKARVAMKQEIAAEKQKMNLPAAEAKILYARAKKSIADRKLADPNLCAPDGRFAPLVREMYAAVAARPGPPR